MEILVSRILEYCFYSLLSFCLYIFFCIDSRPSLHVGSFCYYATDALRSNATVRKIWGGNKRGGGVTLKHIWISFQGRPLYLGRLFVLGTRGKTLQKDWGLFHFFTFIESKEKTLKHSWIFNTKGLDFQTMYIM